MLDDHSLSELFGRAAESFEVPASGVDEILTRAERGLTRAAPGTDTGGETGGPAGDEPDDGVKQPGAADELGRRRRIVAVVRRRRTLSAAAVVVLALVVAGTLGVLGGSSPHPTIASLRAGNEKGAGVGSGAPATTTTLPANSHASAGPALSPSTGAPNGASGLSSSSTQFNTQNQGLDAPALPKGAVGQSAKIEQTGTLDLTVMHGALTRTMTGLTNLAGAVGGFVASSQSQNGTGGGSAYGTITIEVPVGDFASVLKAAERYGKTSNVTTNATDVTGQYVDLQARLTALEASRQQYLTILAKATSIGDILSVQEQLDGIQQQIEQLQGQLNLLTSQTSYSKVTVTVNEGSPPAPGPLPESGLVQAWHDSIGGFVAGVEGVVRLAGPLLFALLCLALVAVGGRVLWRRYQRHRL